MPGGGLEQNMTLRCHELLAYLLYSFKYEMKDKYFATLEKLKPYLDDQLYNFFYNFGFNSRFLRRSGYGK